MQIKPDTFSQSARAAIPAPAAAQPSGPRILSQSTAPAHGCFHGGIFFNAIGPDFKTLDQRHRIINADVLDAWFDPSPNIVEALTEHLPWLIRTSPPTHSEGLVEAISTFREIPCDCVLPGAGSSDLIFLALQRWLTPRSRVLILDPTYGEYRHVLQNVIGCRIDRLELDRARHFDLDLSDLERLFGFDYDLVILVNPNSPTGRAVSKTALEQLLRAVPRQTCVWVDETYVEYLGGAESLETFAVTTPNVVVCKSMSKVYALSGLRVAYLAGAPALIDSLRPHLPPWAVSLPAQVAAVSALQDADYYRARYRETHALRLELQRALTRIGMTVVPGCANFLLFEIPSGRIDAAPLIHKCQDRGLFLRDAGKMSASLNRRMIRIAVKQSEINARMIRIISDCLTDSASSITF